MSRPRAEPHGNDGPAPFFGGRATWLGDLAWLVAAELRAHAALWLGVVLVTAALSFESWRSTTLSRDDLLAVFPRVRQGSRWFVSEFARAPWAAAIACGLVFRALLAAACPAISASDAAAWFRARRTPCVLSLVAACAVALELNFEARHLRGSGTFHRARDLAPVCAVAVTAAALPRFAPRSRRGGAAVSVVVSATLVLAATWLGAASTTPLGARFYLGPRLLEYAAEFWGIVALTLLALAAARGAWLLPVLAYVLSDALMMSSTGVEWLTTFVIPHPSCEAARDALLVVFAARVAAACAAPHDVRIRATDAAGARLAERFQLRPWRALLLGTVLGRVFIDTVSPLRAVRGGPPDWAYVIGGGVCALALTNPVHLPALVGFHALRRASHLGARIPALLAPASGALLWIAVHAVLRARIGGLAQVDRLAIAASVTALGAMLPALAGALLVVVPMRAAWRLIAWSALAVWTLCVIAPPGWNVDRQADLDAFALVSFAAPVAAVLVWHAGVLLSAPTPRMLLWASGWVAAVVVASGATLACIWSRLDVWSVLATQTATLLTALASSILAIALARRLTSMTVLPADHGVVLWKEALAAHDAATGRAGRGDAGN